MATADGSPEGSVIPLLEEANGPTSQTLAKGLTLLEAVAASQGTQGVALFQLAKDLRWNKSTTYRLLTTLEAAGYIQKNPETGRSRLGLKVLHLGAAFSRDLELRNEAGPILLSLESKTHQTVSLVVLDEPAGEVVYVDRVDGSHALRMHTYVGMRFPANCAAAGKAILAYLPEARLQRILDQELASRTPHSIRTPGALRQDLLAIRTRGYATDDQENAEGVRCVGAPIFDHSGRATAAISISGPAFQIPPEEWPTVGPIVRAAADEISQRLGFRQPIAV